MPIPPAHFALAACLPLAAAGLVLMWALRLKRLGRFSGEPGHLHDWAERLQSLRLQQIAVDVAALGSSTLVSFFTALAAAGFLFAGHADAAFGIVAVSVLAASMGTGLKRLTGRIRPERPASAYFGSSFPSSHTLMATAFYPTAAGLCLNTQAYMAGALAVVAALIAFAVGVSRVVLRVHYVSDVIAGWVVGLSLFASAMLLMQPGEQRLALFSQAHAAPGEAERMVIRQLIPRDIRDERVLKAMRTVPRERFVPETLRAQAYDDRPLPIGHGQTISQPYIVAFMTEALQLDGDEKVLEIGTGSGYQAAVLAHLAREVYSIEIVEPLALQARQLFNTLSYSNLRLRSGDGYRGWPEAAPFDGIMLTAAPDHVPQPLIDQLAMNGRLVLPVGTLADDGSGQALHLIERKPHGLVHTRLRAVRFVPMTGEAAR